MKSKFLLLLTALAALSVTQFSHAQGTAFSYQGRLNDGDVAANGTYDLTFKLFSLPVGGAPIGLSLTNSATGVSNGLFTLALDFGAGAFPGADRWLEIGVSTNGGGALTTLSPRQKIGPVPYAITASNLTGTLPASRLSGLIPAANIGAGSITTTMLAPGSVGPNQIAAGAVTTPALAGGAVTATNLASVLSAFVLTLTNPTPVNADSFGYSVASVGEDRVLIGTEDGEAAYLFSANGKLLQTFTSPMPANNNQFGSAVAAFGEDRVLIGAYGNHPSGFGVGAAYLFSTNGMLLTTFTNAAPTAHEDFGKALAALGSDRVLIGTPGHITGTTTNAGAAYLFNTNGTLLSTFINPRPASNDAFGFCVTAVGSDRVLIGAHGADIGPSGPGAAYLFRTNGALITTFTNPTPAEADFFGYSVAALGSDRVLIGAPLDDTSAFNAGAAYLFSTNGTLLTTFVSPTLGSQGFFGWSVAALGNDRVLIGARGESTGAPFSGAAYLLNTNGALLLTLANPTPAQFDEFGYAVAGVGDGRVLVSATGDNTGASGAGAAYLFTLETYSPGVVAAGIRAGAVSNTSLGDNAITSAKIEDGAIQTADLADGSVTAAKISGTLNASQIPNLDASKITGGTLTDGRLSPNVALLDTPQIFTGSKSFGSGVQVLADNGSAAAPGISFSGDGDTGLFHPLADNVAIATSAAERLRVDASGRIGIGTPNPSRALEVQHAGDAEIGLGSTDAGAHLWTLQSSSVSGNANRDASFQIIDRTLGSARVLVHTNGSVGIGATSPLHRLHIGLYGTLGTIVSAPLKTVVENTNDNARVAYLAVAGPGSGSAISTNRVEVTFEADESSRVGRVGTSSTHSMEVLVGNTTRLFLSTNGNVGIGTSSPTNKLHVNGGVTCTALVQTSDRAAKQDFQPICPREVLEKVAALPITRWRFKTLPDGQHLGPMAQDFYAAFQLGGSDTTITAIDTEGVALAAIQGLNQKMEAGSQQSELRSLELEDRARKLEAENRELKARLSVLEKFVTNMGSKGN